jgi:hypothetical protein
MRVPETQNTIRPDKVYVMDMAGQTIAIKKADANGNFDVKDLKPGLYIFTIKREAQALP